MSDKNSMRLRFALNYDVFSFQQLIDDFDYSAELLSDCFEAVPDKTMFIMPTNTVVDEFFWIGDYNPDTSVLTITIIDYGCYMGRPITIVNNVAPSDLEAIAKHLGKFAWMRKDTVDWCLTLNNTQDFINYATKEQ